MYQSRRCLLIPEREGFIPVFPNPSEISFLRGCDGMRDCTFTKASSSARPALIDEEGVAVEGHERPRSGHVRQTPRMKCQLAPLPLFNAVCPPGAPPLLFFPLPFIMSQVSTLPSPSYLNGASLSSNANPPDSEASPAELLRQAALSSRKLKRRKLDTSPPAPPFSRPPPRSIASTPSISLDYGQEEHSTPASPTQQPLALAPARIPTPTRTTAPSPPPRAVQRDGSNGAAVPTPQSDDASMREEGEISDNEDPPFRPPPRSIPAPITLSGVAYPDIKLEPRGSVQSPRFGTVPRSPSFIAEVAYRHATPPGSVTTFDRRRSIEGQPTALKTQTSSEPFRLETPLYVLDADHVRPGLSCSSISNSSVALSERKPCSDTETI